MSCGWAPIRAVISWMLTYAQVLRGTISQHVLMRREKAKGPITFEGLPGEIITLIALSERCVSKDKYEYNLSVEDLCNLRFVNKHTNLRIQHAFAVRCFRHRDHMISEFSLSGLRNIARHPIFGQYVREVSLGPERIPAKMKRPIIRSTPLEQGEPKDPHEMLRYNQLLFESSGDAVQLLKDTLISLPKMNVLFIRTYPWKCKGNRLQYHGYDWKAPWGLSTLIRSMTQNTEETAKNNEVYFEGGHLSNLHLDIILQALKVIADRPNWILYLDLNSDERYIHNVGHLYYSPAIPFIVESNNWTTVQDRVRRITLHRSILSDGRLGTARIKWLSKLFKSCGSKLDVLQCHNSTYWAAICNDALPLSNLRRIDLRHCTFPDGHFRQFLQSQRYTLESMRLDGVDLIDWDPVLRKIYSEWILSWKEQFGLMLQMTRLREVNFNHLSWLSSEPLEMPEDIKFVIEAGGWSRSITAEGPGVEEALSMAYQNNAVSEQRRCCDIWDHWNKHRGHWMMFEIRDTDEESVMNNDEGADIKGFTFSMMEQLDPGH